MYGLKLCMHMQHMQLFKQAIVPRYNLYKLNEKNIHTCFAQGNLGPE